MKKNKTLRELFSFPGFKACNKLEGKFGDPISRVIVLVREKKQQIAHPAENEIKVIMIKKYVSPVT